MKKIKAVKPYIHSGYLNFKFPAYQAWVTNEGDTLPPHFPLRLFHGLAHKFELPDLWKNKQVAVLMFVEPVSITFDTFPYYATHETIPFIWDCWPCYYDKMEKWFRRHKVRTAIFTSSQEMEEMRKRVPEVNYIHCPEAVDSSLYIAGKPLNERSIDLLEFGRSNAKVLGKGFFHGGGTIGINHVCTKVGNKFIYNNDQLYKAMGDAKVTICLPKSMTHPQIAKGVETLTQRYWEAMLSRMVIVGHTPQELIDVCGYNPVVELNKNQNEEIITNVIEHIEDYQQMVDENRETALRLGDWKYRMKQIKKRLVTLGYII